MTLDLTKFVGAATGAQLNAGAGMYPMLERAKAADLQGVRFSAQWERIEPVLGHGYDWTQQDQIMAACQKLGLQVVLEAGTRDNELYAPGVPAAAVRFWTALVQRYPWIMATAPFNEIEHKKVSAHPTAANYVNLIQKPGYEAIKKVAPHMTVLTSGLGGEHNDGDLGTSADFVTLCYQLGWKGYFDALAFHPYSHPDSWLEGLTIVGSGPYLHHQIRQTMRANADGAKQSWFTEDGWPTGGNRQHDTQAVQAAHLVEWITEARKHAWAGPCFVFCLDDKGKDPANYGDWMGMYDAQGKPKLAVAAVKQLIAA